ncbi:MAG: hypothetical protein GY875_22030, partial [Gammaproteobacteria bacterium]|nr:hypothetical protein [Gammaproteobacteria bacterium]
HFHMLFRDGVYAKNKQGKTAFQRTNAPDQEELAILVHTISHRVLCEKSADPNREQFGDFEGWHGRRS